MTGQGHLVSGTVMAVDAVVGTWLFKNLFAGNPLSRFFESLSLQFDPISRYDGVFGWLMLAFSLALYYLGLLFPDIDNDSRISRTLGFKAPLKHRGFTHSLWFVIIFGLPAFVINFVWVLRFFAIGMLVHDFVDGFSTAGWVPFYPFGHYKIAYGNVVCTENWHWVLYTSSDLKTERTMNAVFACTSIVLLCCGFFTKYGVWDMIRRGLRI